MSNDTEDPRPRQYAVMWDCHGLESIVRVPDPADATFALLKGEKPPELPNLMHWKLRARYNSQRHYEIYIVTTDASIGLDDMINMFKSDPQSAADLIRERGHCYYSDRQKTNDFVIR